MWDIVTYVGASITVASFLVWAILEKVVIPRMIRKYSKLHYRDDNPPKCRNGYLEFKKDPAVN